MVNWMKNRMKERTSWDGAVCVALGLMILFMTSHSLRLQQDLQSHGVYGQSGNQNDWVTGRECERLLLTILPQMCKRCVYTM